MDICLIRGDGDWGMVRTGSIGDGEGGGHASQRLMFCLWAQDIITLHKIPCWVKVKTKGEHQTLDFGCLSCSFICHFLSLSIFFVLPSSSFLSICQSPTLPAYSETEQMKPETPPP